MKERDDAWVLRSSSHTLPHPSVFEVEMGDMPWNEARGTKDWFAPARRATFARSAAATPRASSARDEPQRNARRDRLREVAELPRAFQSLFSSFTYFNGIQGEMIDYIMATSRSFVVSACARRLAPAPSRARRRVGLPLDISLTQLCLASPPRRPQRQRQDGPLRARHHSDAP